MAPERVTETRSTGFPTWTILYVDPDREGYGGFDPLLIPATDPRW